MSNKIKGNIYIFLTAICLAFSTAYAHILVQNINPIVLALYSFSLTTLILLSVRIFYFGGICQLAIAVKNNYKNFLMVNLTSAADWLLFLIALKYMNGALVNAIIFGITPLVTLTLSKNNPKIQYLFCSIILLLLFIIGWNDLHIENINKNYFMIAVALSICAGIAVAGTTIFLKRLSNYGVAVLDVILMRYLAIIMISAAVILLRHYPIVLTVSDITKMTCISFLFVLLPAYFIQKGIAHVSAFSATLMSASIPALTYLVSIFMTLSFHWLQLFAIVCLSAVLIVSNRFTAK